METLPVTLIVKAPNQQIEDQTIKCELSWTINKLKQHLQEVYPSKPPKHEQKLIYSGQLLNDSAMLKDVLRQYDGQKVHTVHLVCPLRNTPPSKSSVNPPEQRMPEATTSASPSSSSSEQTIPQANVPWLQGTTIDPNHYALHLAWMQQAYMQYLNQQYLNLAVNGPGTAGNVQFPAQPNLLQQNPNAAPQNDQIPGEAAGGQVEEAAQPQVPAAQPRDPENPERDWLDVFYMLSRAIVLFTFVYFYSSPLRFLFVLLLGFGLYLYHIGFFRNIHNINNNNNNNIDPPGPVPQEVQTPSRLTVVWTFFTSFFASLIPEIPNAV